MEETVIYADILFFINFVTDGIALGMAALLLGRAFVPLRFLCGCTLGGLYSLAALPLNATHPLIALVCHVTAAVIICIAAFPWKGFRNAVASAICFFIACALLGGGLWAVYSLCGSFAVYNGAFYAELSPLATVAAAIAVGAVFMICIAKTKGRASARHGDIQLYYKGKSCTLFCLADSGNLLCCPFTALPVVIVSAKAMGALFNTEELDRLKATPAGNGLRPIPVRGIGGSVVLPSFVPDTAKVRRFGKKQYSEKRLCIAIDFSGKTFGGCDGVAPANIF
ncbi:MAG: hypothetical protein E7597_01825 [Ruminococcaceae bacterium]|nr:hypothetical protein [Oscillospiraceae bacterium]